MSKKIKFSDVTEKLTVKETKKLEREAVLKSFDTFKNKPLPKEVDVYEWEDKDLLIEVFYHDFSSKDDLKLEGVENASNIGKLRYFPVAKVLASGHDSKYKPGDLVKLKDIDVASIENIKYQSWKNTPYEKSNMNKLGEEPLRFKSNIYQIMGKYMFSIDFFDLEHLDSGRDDSIYKVYDDFVSLKIKNIDSLVK